MPQYRNQSGQIISQEEFNRLEAQRNAAAGGGVRWDGTNYVSATTPVSGTTAATGTATGVPTPTGGQGAFGLVPGATTTVNPANLYSSIYPNLSADLGAAQGNNAALIRGEIPQDTASRVWDRRAAQAAGGGVSGSGFTGANTARDLGLTRLDLQNKGQANLNAMLGTTYQTGVAPAVELSQNNAQLAAAPDPAAAAAEQQRVFAQNQANAFAQQQALLLQQFARQQSFVGGASATSGARSQPAQPAWGAGASGGTPWWLTTGGFRG